MQVKKQQLELDMEQQTGSKSGKENVKAVYCDPACLAYMQSQFSQFSCSVMSDSLQPHGLQHSRPPCPSKILKVYSNTCPLMPSKHLMLCHHLILRKRILVRIAGINRLTSIQFSCSVMSNSWQPHEMQHARPPCPSPTPGVHSDSHPSSQ